jgi:hypothetical protein
MKASYSQKTKELTLKGLFIDLDSRLRPYLEEITSILVYFLNARVHNFKNSLLVRIYFMVSPAVSHLE